MSPSSLVPNPIKFFAGGSSLDTFKPAFRWTSQELTKVATVAQMAAPPGGGEVSKPSAWDATALAFPGAHESGDSCTDRSPPGDGEVSKWSAYDVTALALPGAHESGDSCADRSPSGDGELAL